MGTHPIFESDFDCLTECLMETIAPKPSDFPEMDATLVKCIAYMQVGGKESRRSLKELINDLVSGNDKSESLHSSRSNSPSVGLAQTKVDKRKGTQLDKDQIKKARLDQNSEILPRFTNKPGLLTEPCTVCGSAENKENLIECNDCHLFYHKDCHDPPVDEKTMLERQNDPRFIWQCKSCISQISRITTKKRAESQQKEKNPASEPFKRQDKLQNIKSASSSREGSPSLTGWGGLLASEEKEGSSKRKKEKKSALQTIDMFGGKSEESVKKGKKEVNPSAVKAEKKTKKKTRKL